LNVVIAACAPEATLSAVALAVREAPSNVAATTLPRVLSRLEEGAILALMKITQQSRAEARERVLKALQMLSGLGRAPTADEIFATAYYGQVMESGGKVRRCGIDGSEAGKPQNETSKAHDTIETPEPGDPK
jgi:hypothetical protein